jgi:hypothetical protein
VVAKEELPATVSAPPRFVIAPTDDTIRLPPTFDDPRSVAVPLVRLASLAPVLASETLPVNRFPTLVSVIALAPALKLEAPPTVSVPISLTAPEITARLPPTTEVPKAVATVLIRLTSFAPEFVTVTVPAKSLPALVKVIGLAPVLRVVVPATSSAPDWVSAPEVTWRLPPIVVPASWVASVLTRIALPVPLGANVTAPVSALAALFTVIDALFAVVVKDEVAPTVKAPVSVIAPADDTIRLPPTLDAASAVAPLLIRLASFAPVVVSATVLLKRFPGSVRAIALAPLLNADVPVTVSGPLCDSSPPAVTLRVPLMVVGAN